MRITKRIVEEFKKATTICAPMAPVAAFTLVGAGLGWWFGGLNNILPDMRTLSIGSFSLDMPVRPIVGGIIGLIAGVLRKDPKKLVNDEPEELDDDMGYSSASPSFAPKRHFMSARFTGSWLSSRPDVFQTEKMAWDIQTGGTISPCLAREMENKAILACRPQLQREYPRKSRKPG